MALLGYLITLALGVPIGLAFTPSAGCAARCCWRSRCRRRRWGWSCPCSRTPAQSEREVGQTAIVAATVADFSAIVLLSLLFSASDGSTGSRLVL